ncbi:Major facilitator superfamily protein isoform 1 [Theobroma cacao]|uniref:Major facilitator superfamily protein isoform 1 n=1 Tax=Theobroma cacao TaxID=3641 RepID=A0A061E9K6_THECC|nr:Major facilitator superfamily protein isoform 1 [Theobroma cacao]
MLVISAVFELKTVSLCLASLNGKLKQGKGDISSCLLFSKGMMSYVLANLMTFLTDLWKLKLKEAAAIVNLQEGLRNMLQICVALCIDACLGYRWMLILSSVLYSTGLGLLAYSVPPYFNKLKHSPFWEGLALVIVGGAAQVIPLYSLSFEQTKVVRVPEHCEATRLKVACCLGKVRIGGWRRLQQRIIRWFGIGFMMLGAITSVYGFIYLEDEWHQRFLRSAIAIVTGLLWFLCGFPFYGPRRLQPSPLSTMLRTLIAAARKSHLNYGGNLEQLHRDDGKENPLLTDHLEPPPSHSTTRDPEFQYVCSPIYPLNRSSLTQVHSGVFGQLFLFFFFGFFMICSLFLLNVPLSIPKYRWLNKAAVKESSADDNLTPEEKRWRLCTVKEVEQTKLLLNIIPMSATFIVYGMVKSLGNTFFIEQVSSMSGDISSVFFQMIQWFSQISIKRGYKFVFEKRIERIKGRYSDGVKIGIGMLSSVICCAVASSIESKRLQALSKEGRSNDPDATAPITAFWLVLQFSFLGAMEGLAGDGIQDFFGHYAPDSRRYGPVFTSSLTGFGTVLNIGFIAFLDYYSTSRHTEIWLGDSINQSRLDLIYRAYAMVALLNCFIYAYVSYQYSYDNIIGRPEEEKEIPFLEVKEEETAEGDQQNNQEQDVELQRIPVR